MANVLALKRSETDIVSQVIPYCLHTIEEDEIQEVIKTLKSDWLTSGPKTLQFERMFSNFIGSRYGIAVNSCTAALHLALCAHDIKSGDEVITTPMTFCATAEVIEYQQAIPVFVDIDPTNFNIDANLIEEKITPRTRAIIPVHYGGIPCDLFKIYDIAERYGLIVVEDAAHAVGSIYHNQRVGSFGNPTAFSFYPTKNMTTGEGGMITTNDEELANKFKVLSLHGISKDGWKRYGSQAQWYYEIHHLGYKYNFTDLQAALGIHQLMKLDSFNRIRELFAKMYFEELRAIPQIQMPDWYGTYFNNFLNTGVRSSWHLFVILLDHDRLKIDRNQFIEKLKSHGIVTSVHFIPLHLQPYYAKKYGYKKGEFPVTESAYEKIISLPLYPKLTEKQIYHIVEVIRKLVDEFRL